MHELIAEIEAATLKRRMSLHDLVLRFDPDNPFTERTPDDLLRERDRIVMQTRLTGRCILVCLVTSLLAWVAGAWAMLSVVEGWL